MEKIRNILCPLVFCLFLLILSGLLLFWPDRAYSEVEKQYLAQSPDLSVEAVLDGTYQQDLEDWVEAQFPGRELFVGINAYWQLLQGRNVQQGIYYAEDGYLINDPETLNMENFERNLGIINGFAERIGVPTDMILVPSTGSMLTDKLPLGHGDYADDSLFQTAQTRLTQVDFADLRPALAAQTEQVFYRTDHHLTAAGNYALYAAWREQQGKAVTPRADFQVETIDGFCGTTWSGSGYWLTEPDTVELWDSGAAVTVTITDAGEEPVISDSLFFREHLEELDMYPVYLDGNHTLVEIENPRAPEGTILLIKDSYAHCFAPFLADHYQKVILVDLRFYRLPVSALIEEMGVDEVLFLYGANTLLTDTNLRWLS